MSRVTDESVLGTHWLFFPESVAYTVPGAGTCARESKPGATDPAWIYVGIIEDSEDEPVQEEEIPIFRASPGRLVKYRNLSTKVTQKGSATCKSLSALALQVLYRTDALTTASTQFNRLAGKKVQGWLKRQIYDGNDAAVIVEDIFVELKVKSAVKVGGGLAEVNFEYEVLQSTLNTATI